MRDTLYGHPRRMPEAESMDHDGNRATRGVLIGLLVLIAVGAALDLRFDAPTDLFSLHVVYEVTLALASAAMAALLWRAWFRAERDRVALTRSLAEQTADRDAWRREAERALASFASAIGGQFDVWALTPAEREVALLLLKGRSHKEIAAETGRSERTARQHAVAVYAKAGLDGRAALAAFFLDALTLPVAATNEPSSHSGGGKDGPGLA